MAIRKDQAPQGSDASDPSDTKADTIEVLKSMLDEFQMRDEQRQRELENLGTVVKQLTQVSSLECIVANGFEGLNAMLGPLANLAPQREPLDRNVADALRKLLKAQAQPSFANILSLPVSTVSVPYIGAAAQNTGSLAS